MPNATPTVLLISRDSLLHSELHAALACNESPARLMQIECFSAARQALADLSPELIILQQAVLAPPEDSVNARIPALADIAALLAGFAPLIVVGDQPDPPGLHALIGAGVMDYVPDGEGSLAELRNCVESRLHAAHRLHREFFQPAAVRCPEKFSTQENFGEILRHELNNPLTGILGNAELLLAESRRHHDAQLSAAGLKRLETIAALAVRMRETVRRLSQACDSREHARSL